MDEEKEGQRFMTIKFLGTGTSTGVPVIGCKCSVCLSDNPKNKRTRTSTFVEYQGKKFIIDTTPDFRQQAISNGIFEVDGILITHSHADHINGFDDVRQLNFAMNWKIIPVFMNRTSYWEFQSRFDYIFKDLPQLAGGKPLVRVYIVEDYDDIVLDGVRVKTFFYYHGNIKVNGYRFGSMSYLTDVSFIPGRTLEVLKGTEILIISALRYLPHSTHYTVSEVINLTRLLKPKVTYLIHMGHEIDYDEILGYLKGLNIIPAYDGLVVEV
ncbi:MAG: MBL fold metallo-hydrolase [Brevinematales bacterium]|nr:MBL fold metallo-hydrolase [Brevinematales bacterium]